MSGTPAPCPQCGAPGGADDCRARFERLLALDHARRPPWGPRHGLAVAVYTLQHPDGVPRERLETCWLLAYRCAVLGDDPARLARGIRSSRPATASAWGAADLPSRPGAGGLRVTIHDLGDFEAERYPGALLEWARATVAWWQGV